MEILKMKPNEIGYDEMEYLRLNNAIPEFNDFFDSDGKEIDHDSPWHDETLWEHVKLVCEAGLKFNPFESWQRESNLFAICVIWHDHAKPKTRKPKTRYICNNCGASNTKPLDLCKKCNTIDKTEKIVMGYHGHEKLGSETVEELLENHKFDLSKNEIKIIKIVIKNHLLVHELIFDYTNGNINPKKWLKFFGSFCQNPTVLKMAICLSLADNEGRICNAPSNYESDKIDDIDYFVSRIMEETKTKRTRPSDNLSPEQVQTIKEIVKITIPDYALLDKSSLFKYLAKNDRQDLIKKILEQL